MCFWEEYSRALLATVLTTLLGWAVPLLVVYGALAVVLVGIFAGLAWRVRSAALEVLASADRAHGFHASLSTAYEYLYDHATNPFVPGLAAVAERLAPRVDARRVFPLHLPRRVWGIPVLVAVTFGFSMLKVTPLRFDEVHEPDVARHVSREGQRLEKWGRDLEELAKREQLDRSMILARQMQQLGQRLQREGGEQGQATERIATLSQYLQRLQQELRERALMSDIGAMAAHDVLMSGQNVKRELRDILQMLQQDVPPRDMAAMAEPSVLRLSRQMGQNPQLENLLQNLRAGDLEAARQLLRDVLQQQQASEEVEHLDRARRALEYSSRSIQRGGKATPQRAVPGHSQTLLGKARWIWVTRACSRSLCLVWRIFRRLGPRMGLALRLRHASIMIQRCASRINRCRMSRSKAVRALCG